MGQAIGFLEVYGLVAAFAAGDAGCKAADVTMEPFDKNKPANADKLPVPLIVLIKFRGSVEDVKAAIAAAKTVAENLTGVISSYVIAAPDVQTEPMFKLKAFDKT